MNRWINVVNLFITTEGQPYLEIRPILFQVELLQAPMITEATTSDMPPADFLHYIMKKTQCHLLSGCFVLF